MTWLLWRQHRLQVTIAAALLAAFALPVWITGTHLASDLAACRRGDDCGLLFQHFNGINIVVDLTVALPVLIGVFWGATLFARELELGTAALVWTQSTTRRRWLAGKLTTLFGMAALCSAVDAALVTWWSDPHNSQVETRFAGLQFDIQGVVPVAYAVFAAAVGLLAGALWRRTLPAMATTIGGVVGVRLLVELYARPHYLAPVVRTSALNAGPDRSLGSGSLTISNDLVQHGHVVSGPVKLPDQCIEATSRADADACMHRLGYLLRMTYQPAGRYWTFQWIEFGIFVALAAALTAAAVIVLRRRDA
jgi:hypothetical protein